jgi:hypothetical protein
VAVQPHDCQAKARWLAARELRLAAGGGGGGALGDIAVDRLLGRGAFGAVYHGSWEGKEVAVKMLQVGGLVGAGGLGAGAWGRGLGAGGWDPAHLVGHCQSGLVVPPA